MHTRRQNRDLIGPDNLLPKVHDMAIKYCSKLLYLSDLSGLPFRNTRIVSILYSRMFVLAFKNRWRENYTM